MATEATSTNRLCFVRNRHLQGALVDPLDVCTRGGKRIGTLEGVVMRSTGGFASPGASSTTYTSFTVYTRDASVTDPTTNERRAYRIELHGHTGYVRMLARW